MGSGRPVYRSRVALAVGSNPTVTAIKPPVYRAFFWCLGRGEKELRKNDGETESVERFGGPALSTTVELFFTPRSA